MKHRVYSDFRCRIVMNWNAWIWKNVFL